MDNTPDASETPTPPTVTLRLRPPAACPGSDGWHGRRVDALDALTRSVGWRGLLDSARADLGRNTGGVSDSTITLVLTRLVFSTRSENSTAWARTGEVCESYDHLSDQTTLSVDQLRRAIRVLEHTGALVEMAPALSPTPKHSTGRPPRRTLPWLYDHDMLSALVSGQRIIVEVDQAAADLDPTLDLDTPSAPEERGRASATPLVDNSTTSDRWGRAHARGWVAPARPSSDYSELVTDTEKVPVGDPHRETSHDDDNIDAGRGDPPISTDWLDQAAEVSGVTVDELRAEVLDIWHLSGENITDLDVDDPQLVEYLSTPADRRRELHTGRIALARHVHRRSEPVKSWTAIRR